ncbi:hypothetical protein BU16DRAFT_496653 [Lophium mytilinum]|uniref:Uncharacterized protein n=1 Tax=Lophium mytilinum TaxID=390894 RepID=A0A6A6Q952_9PEZI|nr:hypothetical protein BU16DRAFT_496653 [Lophium mytilinum]
MPPPLPRRTGHQCLFYRPSCRTFATTPARHAGISRASPNRGLKPSQRATQSPTLMLKEQHKGAAGLRGLPTDMGLLPGTIIKPTGKNLPSIFRKPRVRLDIEWQNLKRGTMDRASLIHWKFFLKAWKDRPRPKLERRKLVPLAKDYHKQIYSAFAAHDAPTITRLCCSGLTSDFRTRMSHRAPGTHLTWTLSSYTSSPKIVSNRATPLPNQEHTGVRQVVVRLRSKQILTTWTDEQARRAVASRIEALRAAGREVSPALLAVESENEKMAVSAAHGGYNPISLHRINKALSEDTEALAATDVEKVETEVTEYMVLQRRMLEGVEEGWMVWGFAEESTPEVRARDEKQLKEMEEYQKSQAAAQV